MENRKEETYKLEESEIIKGKKKIKAWRAVWKGNVN